jgi:hypothetical protein
MKQYSQEWHVVMQGAPNGAARQLNIPKGCELVAGG